MANNLRIINKPVAEVKPTELVPDFEQLPQTVDTIKCPTCGTVQAAAIVESRPNAIYLHTCQKCGQVIDKDIWYSVR